MQFTIDQPSLVAALSTAGRFVSTRTLPVLANVLLTVDDHYLAVSATNLAMGVRCYAVVAAEKPGAVTVSARLLLDLVRALPADEPVKIGLVGTGASIAVASGRFKSTLRVIPADEFPVVPTGTDAQWVELDAAQFKRMVGRVEYAVLEELQRPALSGVKLILSDNQLTLAATDGYRLSVATEYVGNGAVPELDALIPAAALREAVRVVSDVVPLGLGLTQNQVFFKTQDITIVSQLVEAKYPDYQQIIPKGEGDTVVSISVAPLAHALKVATLFADNTRRVVLHIKQGSVRVTGQAAEVGDSEIEVPAAEAGPELEIAVNAGYLRDALAAVGEDTVRLMFTAPNRPMVLMPAEDRMAFKAVVMPMSLGRSG